MQGFRHDVPPDTVYQNLTVNGIDDHHFKLWQSTKMMLPSSLSTPSFLVHHRMAALHLHGPGALPR